MKQPRHEGHEHYANVPYGTAVVLISTFCLGVLTAAGAFKRYANRRLITNRAITFWTLITIVVVVSSIAMFLHKPHELNGLAKRAGRVTYAAFPVVLILSLKPSPLPFVNYVSVIWIHKWVSRAVVIIGALHGCLYTIHFIKKGELHKILRPLNFLGVVALGLMGLILITSLGPIRKRWYKVFFMVHYPASWGIVILGFFHARPGVVYLASICCIVLFSQAIYRFLKSKPVQLDVSDVSPTLRMVTMRRNVLPVQFEVGSHVRLSRPITRALTWIQSTHPYTIASLPDDDSVKLLVRKTNFQLSTSENYSVCGAYASINQRLFEADSVLLIAGGSGLSLAAPVYRKMKQQKVDCKLVWVVREKMDLRAMARLEVLANEVYVTGAGNGLNYSETTSQVHKHDMNEDIEFEELLGDSDSDNDEQDMPSENVHVGRPKIGNLGTHCLNGANNWVLAAGPQQLVEEARQWAIDNGHKFTGEVYTF